QRDGELLADRHGDERLRRFDPAPRGPVRESVLCVVGDAPAARDHELAAVVAFGGDVVPERLVQTRQPGGIEASGSGIGRGHVRDGACCLVHARRYIRSRARGSTPALARAARLRVSSAPMTTRARIGRTIAQSEPAFCPLPRPQPGAPNVVMVVLDDLGFAQLGCFGSEIATPAVDRLAAGGLRYNRFHVTALCSPTRACLLTGRNHHAVGMGFLTDVPIGFPGYDGRIPRSAGTLPRLLRDAGYATIAIGKWHLAPRWEQSAAGPFARWPLGLGFERYYGFLNGDTNQWTPELVCDNRLVDPPRSPPPPAPPGRPPPGRSPCPPGPPRPSGPATPPPPKSRSSSPSRPAPRTRRTRHRARGSTAIETASTTAGRRCASASSPASSIS